MTQGITKQWHRTTYPSIDPTQPKFSASGKNIIITGGGSGIGRAIAFAFASAGASSITLIGRRAEPLEQTATDLSIENPLIKVLCEAIDITDRGLVESAMDRIIASVGKLSVLCCNAGVVPEHADFLHVTPEQLRYAFDANIWGPFNMVQCFRSRSTERAIVINISSALAHTSPVPKMAAYSISKVANLKAMEYLASENPDLHVVNMHPGVVKTDMHRDTTGPPDAEFDHPSLPGNFAVWLASPEAAFLRGKMVWANWDVDELVSQAVEIKRNGTLSLSIKGC